MQSKEIRERYLKFFEKRGHKIVPSASLIPADYPIPDKGSLFTVAGMQPMIPYLLGEKHQGGARVVNVQKCVRTNDIDDVGDNRHLTFFEMMGNWSLGDYFKEDSIKWSLEFLTNKEDGLGLDPKRLYMTVFKGENGIPCDEEAISLWQKNFSIHNIKAEVAGDDEIIKGDVRIIPLGVEDNFWIAGATGPCGGDTEMFYDVMGEEKAGPLYGKFSDLVKSGRIMEIWNNVFMEFMKTADGHYEPLTQRNVDTGMGLERTTVVMQGKDNVFETDIFENIIFQARQICSSKTAERIIADHFRSAVFMITDGVRPSNTEAGYILRRILRRAVIKSDNRKISVNEISSLVQSVVDSFSYAYPELLQKINETKRVIEEELEKFSKTLESGLKEFEKGVDPFILFTTYGFPIEMTVELAKEKGINIDQKKFAEDLKKHQELSRTASAGMFKGGLGGSGEMETKYHTATHLLLAGLRAVLGSDVVQKGSNITAERLRFDFNWGEKMTDEQKKKVEDYVNGVIALKLPVTCQEMSVDEAKKAGAMGEFADKYNDVVKVYTVGNGADHYSKEICGGPHVKNTSELASVSDSEGNPKCNFKIIKEEASSAGIRRIKATIV